MKLKKTLAIIMTATLAMATMTGCSQTTINHSKELGNVAKWEAQTSDMQATIDFEAKGENVKLNMTSTGYTLGNDKAYADMKFNDPSGKINIPEMKVYVDNGTTYINKGFYEGICSLTGQPVPKNLSKIKQEYIGIDASENGMEANEIKELVTQPDGMVKFAKLLFGNSDIDIPYSQNGREYTLNLDANQTVDLAGKAVKAVVNNIDNINNNFKLKLTAEDIKDMKNGINDQAFDAGLIQAKAALVGSTITAKESFADDSYKQDMNVNLQIKDFGKVSIQIASSSNKSDVKTFDMPTSLVKLTQEEFNKLMSTETTNTNITQNAESGISSVVMSAVK